MQVIELSDHPGEQLRAVVRQRQDAQELALAAYEQELARHRASVAAARTARSEAWAQRRWLAWLRGLFAVWAEQGRTPSRPVFHHGTTDQEAILTAGMQGEQLVANELGRDLNDDWILLRGYKNSSGEIDHLLLGPSQSLDGERPDCRDRLGSAAYIAFPALVRRELPRDDRDRERPGIPRLPAHRAHYVPGHPGLSDLAH
jgi:hypothetical protein